MTTDTTFIFSRHSVVFRVDARHIIGNRNLIRRGKCRIRIFKEFDGEMQAPRTFVLVTDLGHQNLGPNISTAIKEIADQVCQKFDIEPVSLVLIEHHDFRPDNQVGEFLHQPRSRYYEETFELVHLPWNFARFGEPFYQQSTKTKVEALIGEKLP